MSFFLWRIFSNKRKETCFLFTNIYWVQFSLELTRKVYIYWHIEMMVVYLTQVFFGHKWGFINRNWTENIINDQCFVYLTINALLLDYSCSFHLNLLTKWSRGVPWVQQYKNDGFNQTQSQSQWRSDHPEVPELVPVRPASHSTFFPCKLRRDPSSFLSRFWGGERGSHRRLCDPRS